MYVQSNTLLLADLTENFQNMCLEIYEVDTAKFLSASGLASQAAFKKNKSKIRFFNRHQYVINGRKRY